MAYTFENGNWGNYNDRCTDFNVLRDRLGFSVLKELHCSIGAATLYSRDTKHVKWPYEFVCKIYIKRLRSYHVWIKNLPSVFQFLREIGVYEPNNQAQELIDYLRDDTYFEDAVKAIALWESK